MERPKLILTRGIPASGKSTWARQMVCDNPGKYTRVNKDDLREMMHAGHWSKANENLVVAVQDQLVLEAIKRGQNVIVDNTHINKWMWVRHFKELVGDKADVEVKEFKVSLLEAIRRDKERKNSVGKTVIEHMYNKWVKPIPEQPAPVPVQPPVWNPELPTVILCDIDGTLAHMSGRSPYDWKRVGEDTLDKPVKAVVDRFWDTRFDWTQDSQEVAIILLSGRSEVCRPETERWLEDNGVKYDFLYMRGEKDSRKDFIVKKELYEQHIRDKYNVLFILDDRNQVVDMWRNELGLKVFQVAEGDF